MSFLRRISRQREAGSAIAASSALAVLSSALLSLVARLEPGWPPRFAPVVEVAAGPQWQWFSPWAARAIPATHAQAEALAALVANAAWLAQIGLAIALLSLLLHVVSRLLRQRRDLAIRAALGARWRDLASQVLTPLTRLTVLGAAAGALGAALLSAWLRAAWPELLQRNAASQPWAMALGSFVVALALVLVTALAFVSVIHRRGIGGALHGDHVTSGALATHVQSALAALQLAGLLVAAYGCLLVTRAARTPAAHTPAAAAETSVAPLDWRDSEPAQRSRNTGALGDSDLSAVTSPGAALTMGGELPVLAFCGECYVGTDLRPVTADRVRVLGVTPAINALLPWPVIQGRMIAAQDSLGASLVALVSETAAARLFPLADPIGKKLRPNGLGPGPEYTIIGVVDAPSPVGLGNSGARESLMVVSLLQHAVGRAEVLSPSSARSQVTNALRASGGGVPLLGGGRPLGEVAEVFAQPLRWFATLYMALAAAATGLATWALVSVMLQMVRSRRRDIAIRMAVGAAPRHVLGWVLARTLWIAALGLLTGLSAARGLGELLHRRLSPSVEGDLLLLLQLMLAFGGLTLLAGVVPGIMASRVRPARIFAERP